MAEQQFDIIANLIFQSNVQALKQTKESMAMLAQKTNNVEYLMAKTGLTSDKLSIGMKQMGLRMDNAGNLMDNFGRSVDVASVNMNKLRKSSWRFNMNMLTLMFGFMALQRILNQFGKSAISTYQKANDDTQGLGKSTWQLQAAWEFFKYSLVDALTQSPLFQMLVQWLVQIVQWFNKLSPTAKSIIAWGLAVLFVISTIGVLFAVFQPLISFLLTFVPWVSTLLVGGLGAAFWWVAAIVAIVVALWITDLGGFREFVTQTLGIIWLTFKTIFMSIWKLVKYVIDFIVAIFHGDFNKALEIAWNFLKELTALFLKALLGIGAIIVNTLKFAWNLALDAIQFTINLIIFAINGLIMAMNKIPGINIPLIPKVDMSGMKAAYTTVEQLKAGFDIIDKKMGITAEISSTIPKISDTHSGSKIDNSTNNFQFNINVPDGTSNTEDIAKNIMDQINDQLNRKNDSTL
jgi:hypothetical protein